MSCTTISAEKDKLETLYVLLMPELVPM